jgi:asparagine synthase (glutamine-hydrolysing)
MSGIFGIFRRDGQPVTCAELERMSDTLAHRGPDGHDLWHDGPVGLGHRMLWTTPESLHEQLPFSHRDAGLTITADARIDNRDELLPLLGLTNRPAEFVSDSQVILAAYEKWGEACPEHLLGDFAFVIWDAREQKLFCARDHFGVKPFYYYCSDDMFAFASEIKALFQLASISRRINEDRIAAHLTYITEDRTSTYFQNILRLSPASVIIIRGAKESQAIYWQLDANRDAPPSTDQEYADRFREIFTAAVRCRLRSAGPVGSLLSGGLDSSSIACMARTLLADDNSQPLPTFSAVFDTISSCDERPYINAVLNTGGFDPSYVEADRINPLDEIDRIFWHKDAPHVGPNVSMIWNLHRTAQEKGVRVLLDGNDGDSTVSHGYGYLRELAVSRRWILLAREAAGSAATDELSPWLVIWSYIRVFGIQGDDLFAHFLRWLRHVRHVFKRSRSIASINYGWRYIVEPTYAAKHDLEARYRKWQNASSLASVTCRDEHYRVLTNPIQVAALEEMDALSAARGLESRYPFWDKRLIEFCLSLPATQKLKGGWSRLVMRRAMGGILPENIQWRKTKTEFVYGFLSRLICGNEGRLECLHSQPFLADYINLDALKAVYHRLMGNPLHRHRPDIVPYWHTIACAAWIQNASVAPSSKGSHEGNSFERR